MNFVCAQNFIVGILNAWPKKIRIPREQLQKTFNEEECCEI